MRNLEIKNLDGLKLTRSEMKEIIGGHLDIGSGSGRCRVNRNCSVNMHGIESNNGRCGTNDNGKCACLIESHAILSSDCSA